MRNVVMVERVADYTLRVRVKSDGTGVENGQCDEDEHEPLLDERPLFVSANAC